LCWDRPLISLLQRIRPRVAASGHDGDTRAPVLIKPPEASPPSNQIAPFFELSKAPFNCQAIPSSPCNETNFACELAEHALAHVIGDKAEQAYRRSDALARRREPMDAWARHCGGAAGNNVVTFKRPA
jgi:hypothetical protein